MHVDCIDIQEDTEHFSAYTDHKNQGGINMNKFPLMHRV